MTAAGPGERRGLTRRRSWGEHPLSLPVNLSWALLGLVALAALPIHDTPAWARWIAGGWLLLNGVLTVTVLLTLRVPLEPERRDEPEGPVEGTSLLRDALRRLRKNQLATLSMGILGLMLVLCFGQRVVVAVVDARATSADSYFALHVDHARINTAETFAPPSGRHWFGTDGLGRDLFARTLYGGSISFLVGIVATVVSLVIGVIWGSLAGYFGGRIDHYMMRIVDVLYGLPFMFLVILIMTLVQGLDTTASQYRGDILAVEKLEDEGRDEEAAALIREKEITAEIRTAVFIVDHFPPIIIMFFALGLVQWLTMARITRGQMISLREREFVTAARVIGAGNLRIIFRHIVPNLLGPVIVYTTLTIPTVMLAEAFLSFLGLGISPPACSWGSLASEGLLGINVIKPYWWLITYPAVGISLALFSLNFIGDGLRDALDPRQRR